MDEQVLHGGFANVGAVVRVGDHVLRPAKPNTQTIHRALHALRAAGFSGAPEPVGIDEDGRERLVFIEGLVPTPPYPDWAQSQVALVSIAVLMKTMHDASTGIDLSTGHWSDEMADGHGGPVLCHNDVCLENVVFRDGRAVGLIDFEFAAPGRRVFDLASFARMCVPIDDDVNAARLGWAPADLPARLRLVADTYDLTGPERAELLEILDRTIQRGGEFLRRQVEAGHLGFAELWREVGGNERFDRRRRWWAQERTEFQHSMS
ncbi:MAG: phosphotransferase [Ilumatobacteraceae bacterium]